MKKKDKETAFESIDGRTFQKHRVKVEMVHLQSSRGGQQGQGGQDENGKSFDSVHLALGEDSDIDPGSCS
jgi:hypothetical protein